MEKQFPCQSYRLYEMQVFSQLNACRIDFRQGRNSPRAERRADSRIADRAMQGMGSTLIDK
ncbi:MAG: hypothetical protein CME32_15765 [Gimesia sp.]|nr:hypothetical protein [Gimesia sp.]